LLVHPVIAESYATALGDAVSGESTALDLPTAALAGPDLLRRFAAVSDGRSEQGRDHPVAVVLTLCAAAVLAGMGSFTAIAGWVADVPTDLLAQFHGRPVGFGSSTLYPSKTTVWRVLTGVDAAAVDAAVGAWLGAQAAARPATHTDTLILGQVEVGAKSNEIPQFAPLLDGLAATGADLRGMVITADALCRRRHNASYEDVPVMPMCWLEPLLAAASPDSWSA